MSNLPPEASPILSFFPIPPLPPSRFLETASRIHGFLLLATGQWKGAEREEEFLNHDHFLSSYLLHLGGEQLLTDETIRMESVTNFLDSVFGPSCEFQTDESERLKLQWQGRSYDLFPFFLSRGGSVFWLNRCRPGLLQYTSASSGTLTIDTTQPGFDEFMNSFMEKGWYRLILKTLTGVTEPRNSSLQNRIYSAHCFLACDYYKAGLYREAISDFEKAMKIKSNMPQLYYNLALSHARISEFDRAIHLLNQLNRLRPNQARTFELLGDFHLQKGEPERSLVLYKRGMELSDNKTALSAKIKKVEEKSPRGKQPDSRKEDEREEKFSIQSCLQDLTLEAELGRFPSVLGREKELLQLQEILACQSKKNVLILGEPGVGKTALVQELAYRISAGKASSRLLGRKLMRVNMGSLLAGAKFRGQFEERLLQLIREAKRTNCLLFFDDVHQIAVSAGTRTGSADASQFIKPALMNDEIQMIGATNFDEFRNGIEKDSSFLRCFQVVRLEEPDNETLLRILRAYRSSLESYHRVIINEESLETTLMWVKVLLRDRALPDKALDVLDRAAARISVQEKTAIVSSESILETISEISNTPLNRMSVSETAHYRNLERFLSRRVVGQPDAIATVAGVLCTSKLRMNLNPMRPKGIFLFVGPTGVGKTELARATAEFLFGQEEKIIRIDMSEYMERYSASRLIGTSPGYVGYYDQNQLVDKIRTNPYSLILLDEIEKADPQLLSLFLQVFDAGRLTDGKGKIAYFDNSTIVMTSNVGTHLFAQHRLGYGSDTSENVTRSDLLKEVKRFFQPEFLNRIDEIVFFNPLTVEDVRQIAEIKLMSILDQLRSQDKELLIEEQAMTELCKLGYDYEYGARNLERILRRYLLDKLAGLALSEDWPAIRTIRAVWQDGEVILKTDNTAGFQEVLTSTLENQDYLEE